MRNKQFFFCVGSGVKENIPITENVNVLIKPFRFTVLVGFRTTGEGFGRFPSPFHLLSIFCLTDPPKNRTLKSTCENWNWKLCVGQASVKNPQTTKNGLKLTNSLKIKQIAFLNVNVCNVFCE